MAFPSPARAWLARFALIGLAVVGLVAAGCGDMSESASTASPTTASPTTASPTTAVPTSAATTTVASSTPASTTEPPAAGFDAIGPIVEAHVEQNGLNGAGLIVVDRDEGVVYHEHWGEFTPERVSLIASSSKMISAGVLLNLADRGLVNMDAPISAQLQADWAAGNNPAITPAQLVSNSSGLVGLGPNPAYGPYVCQFFIQGTLQECGGGIFATPADDGDVAPPDTEFRYGGAQWQVAGAVAEAASGQTWAELIEEIYVQPCGVDSLGFNNPFTQFGVPTGFGYPGAFNGDPSSMRPTENPNIEGGAYITSGDYGALLLMHLRGGMCGETQVLSTDALERMHTDRVDGTYGEQAAGADSGYGMGWWVEHDSGYISDAGAFGSVPWLDLEDGYGVYLVVEATNAAGRAIADDLYGPIDKAMAALTG